jgi:hypothetical protein
MLETVSTGSMSSMKLEKCLGTKNNKIGLNMFNYTMKPLSIVSEGTVENDSCGKVIYMDNVQGLEKVNDTCMKTMHVGTTDRGFIVLTIILWE